MSKTEIVYRGRRGGKTFDFLTSSDVPSGEVWLVKLAPQRIRASGSRVVIDQRGTILEKLVNVTSEVPSHG